MSLSLYDISVPAFIRGFGNLSAILKKAEAFADEKGIPHAGLLQARLYEDMLPLTGQIQRVSDTAKFVPVRIGGVETVAMADEEASFADLHSRINRTVDFLKTVDPASMVDKEHVEVVIKTRAGSTTFNGRNYLLNFALPNFYFHLTTAYAILRHKGVPIGKLDFLGKADQ
jgi:hypothetical protein